MLVMNDRPQGGSGFRRGQIELMFNRRGSTQDELGLPETISESFNGRPIRTKNLYLLKFTSTREELYSTIIRETARMMNPVQLFKSTDFEVLKGFDSKAMNHYKQARSYLVKFL